MVTAAGTWIALAVIVVTARAAVPLVGSYKLQAAAATLLQLVKQW